MKKRIYKISRWIHKYFGLIFLLFMAWMSLSGVLLNHPDLIRNVSVPNFLVPGQYQPDNWSRSSLKGVENMGDSLVLYGRQGIFLSTDEGKSFQHFMKGEYPQSAWGKRTHHLYYSKDKKLLLCANNWGCYRYSFETKEWKKFFSEEPIVKILAPDNELLLVGKSNVYSVDISKNIVSTLVLNRKKYSSKVSLITVFFELHDGSIFGLPGRLLWDVAGLILFFLCISAFYIWYYPKKWKRQYKREGKKSSSEEKKRRNFFLKYHKKLGWYFGILLVIITFTGMFLTPVLMMTLVKGSINEKYYPGVHEKNPWKKKIRNALYDHQKDELVLECSDGIWAGKIKGEEEFKKIKLPLRIFGMGATVFEEEKPGIWRIGSFGGLHEIDRQKNKAEKLLQTKQSNHSGRPASTFVTGYVKLQDGEHYVMGHYKGICDVEGKVISDVLEMPDEIKKNSRLPLWNYLFELHNARIFRGGIGAFYMLVIPLGGFLSLLMLLAGILDYWLTKPRRR